MFFISSYLCTLNVTVCTNMTQYRNNRLTLPSIPGGTTHNTGLFCPSVVRTVYDNVVNQLL